jgi:hypothetical protein
MVQMVFRVYGNIVDAEMIPGYWDPGTIVDAEMIPDYWDYGDIDNDYRHYRDCD